VNGYAINWFRAFPYTFLLGWALILRSERLKMWAAYRLLLQNNGSPEAAYFVLVDEQQRRKREHQ